MYGALPYGAYPYAYAPLASEAATPTTAAVVVLSPRDSDLATMSASSEVATLPIANVQTMSPKKVWRTSATEDYANITFAGPLAANMLALNGSNLSAGGVYRVRLASSLAGLTSSPPIDTGWQSVWPTTGKPADASWPRYLSALLWSNDALYQYARVDIADPDNADGYIEVGRLALGRYWQPEITIDLAGTPLGFDQRDVQTVTDYGETFTDRRNASAPRLFNVQISAADKREVFDGIADIRRLRGMWGDVFVLLDPNATTDFHRLSMQGVFTTQQQHAMAQLFTENGEMYSVDLTLREVI